MIGCLNFISSSSDHVVVVDVVVEIAAAVSSVPLTAPLLVAVVAFILDIGTLSRWTVANTLAACSPPMTEIRAFGHMNRNRGPNARPHIP